MIMLVLARGRSLPREKVSREVAKEHSLNGGPHAMIIGSQAVAHKVIIVQSITRGDSQEDVRSAVLPDTPTSQCTRPVKPKAKNAEWDESMGDGESLSGKMINARMKSMRPRKARKVKGKAPNLRASLRGRLHRSLLLPKPTQSSSTKNERSLTQTQTRSTFLHDK